MRGGGSVGPGQLHISSDSRSDDEIFAADISRRIVAHLRFLQDFHVEVREYLKALDGVRAEERAKLNEVETNLSRAIETIGAVFTRKLADDTRSLLALVTENHGEVKTALIEHHKAVEEWHKDGMKALASQGVELIAGVEHTRLAVLELVGKESEDIRAAVNEKFDALTEKLVAEVEALREAESDGRTMLQAQLSQRIEDTGGSIQKLIQEQAAASKLDSTTQAESLTASISELQARVGEHYTELRSQTGRQGAELAERVDGFEQRLTQVNAQSHDKLESVRTLVIAGREENLRYLDGVKDELGRRVSVLDDAVRTQLRDMVAALMEAQRASDSNAEVREKALLDRIAILEDNTLAGLWRRFWRRLGRR